MNPTNNTLKRQRDGELRDHSGDNDDLVLLSRFNPSSTVAVSSSQDQEISFPPKSSTTKGYLEEALHFDDKRWWDSKDEHVEFLFDKSVKESMRPTVTSRFKMAWCWPPSPKNQMDTMCESGHRSAGPTSILELRGDPRLRGGTRPVAIVVSPRQRFMLPLLSRPRESAAVRESGIFWCIPSRPSQEPSPLPPPFAELILGTVQELERVANIIKRSNLSSDEHSFEEENEGKVAMGQTEENSLCQLSTFFFRSLPYRVLWLYQFRECLIVSLSCEERILSLRLQGCKQTNRIASYLSTTAIECVSSFRLPPCVVPLDLSEIYDRPFLAVGTSSHGVLVLLLQTNGVISSVVHRLLLSGLSTSMFPVAHICTVFPPLLSEGCGNCSLGVWGVKSTLITHCLDGTILCSSPYENRTVAVKCGSAGGDGCGAELPPPTRTVAGFLCSTPYSTPTIGPLVATLEGRLLYFFSDNTNETENGDNTTATQSECRQSRHGAFDAVFPEVAYDNGTRPLLDSVPNHFCEGGPVRQKVSQKKYQPRFLRHWLCLSTVGHEVILFDRKLKNYTKHSVINLNTSEPETAKNSTPVSLGLQPQKTTEKNEEHGDLKGTQRVVTPVVDTAYPTALEDGISGLSWLQVRDGMLQVVAAHHQSWLTVVTWKA